MRLYPKDTDTAQGYLLTFFASENSDKPARTAILVCPGGGYSYVAMNHEGMDADKWLNTQGMDAYVLRYRVTMKEYEYRHPVQLDKVHDTFGQIKKRHKTLGVMGFSAGGHLTGLAVTDKNQKYSFGF